MARIKKVAKVSRLARKLFTGSGFSASTWGHPVSPLSDRMLIGLERDALASTGIKAPGRCRAIALVTAFGLQGTPRSRLVRETISVWFDVLKQCDAEVTRDLGEAWFRAKTKCENNPKYPVRGIMTNLICILLKAKWIPQAMDCWIDPQGASWTMTGVLVSPNIIATVINRDLFMGELKRAATHYNGKGIENGIHVNSTFAVLRNLKMNNYNVKCLLETIISAATWPAQRIHDINPEYSNLCPRCKGQPETALHCLWTCPSNAFIEDEAVRITQDLVPTATTQSEVLPCLWLRGIMPSEFLVIPPEAQPVSISIVTWTVGCSELVTSGTYYGDASGGAHTKYPEIRRVGCAFASVNDRGETICAAHFPLPGDAQTVARGELYSLVILIRQVSKGSFILFWTDNKGVFLI